MDGFIEFWIGLYEGVSRGLFIGLSVFIILLVGKYLISMRNLRLLIKEKKCKNGCAKKGLPCDCEKNNTKNIFEEIK